MERTGGEDTGVPTSIRKVIVSSFIGTTILVTTLLIIGKPTAKKSTTQRNSKNASSSPSRDRAP